MATSIAAILARLGLATPTRGASLVPTPAPARQGCEPWCAGRGARRLPAEAHPSVDTVPSYLETMRAIRYEYCSCPAGAEARRRHEAALSTLETGVIQRQAAGLLDAAELPPKLRRYGLDDYPMLGPMMVEKARRWQSASRSAGANLLLYGDVGTFKTTFGAALLREHLADGGSGLFLPVGTFLARIRSSYAAGGTADDQRASEWTLVRAAAAPGLLLLDDIPDDLTDWARRILFDLLYARDLHERPTILTTNLDLAALEAALGKRTFDRFRGAAVDPATGEHFVCRLAGASQRGLSVVKAAGPRA